MNDNSNESIEERNRILSSNANQRFQLRLWTTAMWIGYLTFEVLYLLLQLVMLERGHSTDYLMRLDLLVVLPAMLFITLNIECHICQKLNTKLKS